MRLERIDVYVQYMMARPVLARPKPSRARRVVMDIRREDVTLSGVVTDLLTHDVSCSLRHKRRCILVVPGRPPAHARIVGYHCNACKLTLRGTPRQPWRRTVLSVLHDCATSIDFHARVLHQLGWPWYVALVAGCASSMVALPSSVHVLPWRCARLGCSQWLSCVQLWPPNSA